MTLYYGVDRGEDSGDCTCPFCNRPAKWYEFHGEEWIECEHCGYIDEDDMEVLKGASN